MTKIHKPFYGLTSGWGPKSRKTKAFYKQCLVARIDDYIKQKNKIKGHDKESIKLKEDFDELISNTRKLMNESDPTTRQSLHKKIRTKSWEMNGFTLKSFSSKLPSFNLNLKFSNTSESFSKKLPSLNLNWKSSNPSNSKTRPKSRPKNKTRKSSDSSRRGRAMRRVVNNAGDNLASNIFERNIQKLRK